ncbi:F-box/LRR-repeat protein 4 [Geodia barretti]|uniref:F-box/LRR-repeat protein 4 n=1 Tax=Geodia barretti TaxID=519541 RepID=A0AA35W135_GEOBA|nr:F-box/LRR-repeat protein 4 [Geodia barretti]
MSMCDEHVPVIRNLVSLDLWRCKFASPETIVTIAKSCKDLEEIDIGWCHNVLRVQFDHRFLFGNCKKLKKVFLTSGRIIDDTYLNSIATFCSDIELLDILGSNQVTNTGILRYSVLYSS